MPQTWDLANTLRQGDSNTLAPVWVQEYFLGKSEIASRSLDHQVVVIGHQAVDVDQKAELLARLVQRGREGNTFNH